MSSEIVSAEKFLNPHTFKLVVDDRHDFCVDADWSVEPKSTLSAHPVGHPRKVMHFIEKFSIVSPEQAILTWQAVKKAGLPVVPTLRKTDQGKLLMTDLSVDGSELFGKFFFHTAHEQVNWEMVNKYLKIDFKDIEESAVNFGNIATQNYIMLAYDDPFETLVHPDGSWRLIMLDLTHVEIGQKSPNISLQESNERYVHNFLKIQKEMRKNLQNGDLNSSKWYTWWDNTGI